MRLPPKETTGTFRKQLPPGSSVPAATANSGGAEADRTNRKIRAACFLIAIR
jgi:hypothetical protein